MYNNRCTHRCPSIYPSRLTGCQPNATMRAVDIAKVTLWSPVVTMNSVIAVKVIDPWHIWLIIAAAIGIAAAHILFGILGINGIGAGYCRRTSCAGRDEKGAYR